MVKLVRYQTPRLFFERARDWLLREEAEYNLLLGLEAQLLNPGHVFEQPLYFATLEDEGQVVGCGFRTPPFKLGITRMPAECVRLLAADVAEVYDNLPSVFGPEDAAAAFAGFWTEGRSVQPVRNLTMKIFLLEQLVPPARPAQGSLRLAVEADLSLILRWGEGFGIETGLPGEMAKMAESMISEGEMFIWEDGEACSMVGVRGATPNGIRICYVYTPHAKRGMGYASTSVAELSRIQFENGRKFCFLYTDADNPTSNGIYEALGYRLVAEVVAFEFEERALAS